MSNRRNGGLTLVEVMVMGTLAVVVLGIGMVLMGGSTRALARSEERLDARENGLEVLTALRRALLDAWQYELHPGGLEMLFHTPRGTGVVRYDPATRELLLIDAGTEEARPLGARHVIGFDTRSISEGVLQIALEVERVRTPGLAPLPPFFMEDTITICAIAGRVSAVPFTPMMYAPRSQLASY